jgi:hypothetical protein
MQQDSCVHAHPLPTPPPQAGEAADRAAALSADYSLHDIPDAFVPAKAGRTEFEATLAYDITC